MGSQRVRHDWDAEQQAKIPSITAAGARGTWEAMQQDLMSEDRLSLPGAVTATRAHSNSVGVQRFWGITEPWGAKLEKRYVRDSGWDYILFWPSIIAHSTMPKAQQDDA